MQTANIVHGTRENLGHNVMDEKPVGPDRTSEAGVRANRIHRAKPPREIFGMGHLQKGDLIPSKGVDTPK